MIDILLFLNFTYGNSSFHFIFLLTPNIFAMHHLMVFFVLFVHVTSEITLFSHPLCERCPVSPQYLCCPNTTSFVLSWAARNFGCYLEGLLACLVLCHLIIHQLFISDWICHFILELTICSSFASFPSFIWPSLREPRRISDIILNFAHMFGMPLISPTSPSQ